MAVLYYPTSTITIKPVPLITPIFTEITTKKIPWYVNKKFNIISTIPTSIIFKLGAMFGAV